MRRTYVARAKACALALVILLVAAVAVPMTAGAAPAAVDEVRVRLLTDAQGGVVLAGATISGSAKLPAELQLTVPSGAEILWAGEILGKDPSKDIEAKYDRAKGEGYDVLTLTLTKSRTGQVEYRDPNAVATSGENSTVSVTWTSPVDAPAGLVAVQVPAGANVTDGGGGQLDDSSGTPFYQKRLKNVKAGDTLSLKVTYAGAASPSTPQQPGTPGTQSPGAPAPGAPAPGAPAPGAPAPGAQSPQQPGTPGSPTGPASPGVLLFVGALLVAGTLWALNHLSKRSSRPEQ